jgi:hypothetical protein
MIPEESGAQTVQRKVDPRETHAKPVIGESRWSFSLLSLKE